MNTLEQKVMEAQELEVKRYAEQQARTPKQKATVVEACVEEILGLKQRKSDEMGLAPNGRRKSIDKEWFNAMVTRVCYKHNINEPHIRRVGAWSLSDDIDDDENED